VRVALVNPAWDFQGSVYFGCREAHLPLEYGYARELLRAAGHDAKIFDAQLCGLDVASLRTEVRAFAPEMTVVTTAPSYLFWRCAPPELRVPMQTVRALRDIGGLFVAVGPHASTTPATTIQKLGVDVAVLGECEEVLLALATAGAEEFGHVDSIAYREASRDSRGEVVTRGPLNASDMSALPAIRWERELIRRHPHHHHRFDSAPAVPGAELESSRGCPYSCTFCAKQNFRNRFRRRPLATVLEELDGLIEAGVRYVYFVDEIFLPDEPLLRALVERDVQFGVQLRIDNWSEGDLRLLGEAGCVSIEAGVESVTQHGRSLLQKRCRLSTDELTSLLTFAKQHIPFVQANLIAANDPEPEVERFRATMLAHGVWSNQPVPMFPYPGSPDYELRWGQADDRAWERAHEYYLREFSKFSEIQEQKPLPLSALETLP